MPADAEPSGRVLHTPWTADVPAETWLRALAALRGALASGGPVGLACHADPDGDALGSMLALHLFLRSQGYDSTASWGSDPFVVPPQYTFLPGLQTLSPPDRFPQEPQVLVTFDTGNVSRMGALADRVERSATVIVIDHHASNDAFGDVNLIAPRAAATAMLVDELIQRLGGTVDQDIATCLYTGLVTDTGRFQYRNTDREAMELGSRLLSHGIAHAEMNRQMFETHSYGYLKVLARVLERAPFDEDASLIHSWLTQEDLDTFGVALEETEGVIDVLRSADAAEVTMLCKQLADGTWRVSLRSKGRVDVGALAKDLGGGGHAFSAGFTAQGSVDDVVAAVRDRLV